MRRRVVSQRANVNPVACFRGEGDMRAAAEQLKQALELLGDTGEMHQKRHKQGVLLDMAAIEQVLCCAFPAPTCRSMRCHV